MTVPMNMPWIELSRLGNLSILTLYSASKYTLALLKQITHSVNANIIAGITYRKLWHITNPMIPPLWSPTMRITAISKFLDSTLTISNEYMISTDMIINSVLTKLKIKFTIRMPISSVAI